MSQIYVQPFPGPGPKIAVSTAGGTFPVWSRAGHQLYFLGPDNRIIVAGYSMAGGVFSPGTPALWSPHAVMLNLGGGPIEPYDVSLDGKRFGVMLYPDGTTEHYKKLSLTFILNFADELARLSTH